MPKEKVKQPKHHESLTTMHIQVCAAANTSDGDRLLTTYEILCKHSEAIQPSHQDRGWDGVVPLAHHDTQTCEETLALRNQILPQALIFAELHI